MRTNLILVSILLVCESAFSVGTEFIPVQERAQGQALSGSSLLNDSIYSNPAGSAFTQVYSIEGTYVMPKTFSVSVLDTRTSEIGGGLGYFRKAVPYSDQLVQGMKLSLSGRLGAGLGVGLSGKSVWGPSLLNGQSDRLTDLDTGFLANLAPFQVGATFHNILGGSEHLDLKREVSVGARIQYQDVLFLAVSAQMPWGVWRPHQYGIGAEYVSPYYFALKGGFRIRPEDRENFWSVGASLLAPKISIHYAVDLPTSSDRSPEHVLATTLLF